MESGKLVIFKLRILHDTPQVYSSVAIAANFSWQAKLCGKLLHQQCQLLQNVPELLHTTTAVGDMLSKLEHDAAVCTGNDEAQFLTLAAARGGKFFNRASKKVHVYKVCYVTVTVDACRL